MQSSLSTAFADIWAKSMPQLKRAAVVTISTMTPDVTRQLTGPHVGCLRKYMRAASGYAMNGSAKKFGMLNSI